MLSYLRMYAYIYITININICIHANICVWNFFSRFSGRFCIGMLWAFSVNIFCNVLLKFSFFLPSFFLFLTAVIMFVIAHVTDRFPRLPATMTFSDAVTSPAVVACARETLWHSHMCDVMHWFVMAFFIHACCFNWLIHECATTQTRVRHDSFVTWLICDMTHLWHDSFVTWLICDMTHLWHDSFVTW